MSLVSKDPGVAPRRPVVGICARSAPISLQGSDIVANIVLQSHVDMLAAAGCLPLLLPLLPGAADLVGGLDGLLVPGGPDVDPALYGQTAHRTSRGGSPVADAAELELVGTALRAGLPVLAICRGMQLLNVLGGGTLHQHLPEVTGHDGHRPPGAFTLGATALKVEPDSLVAAIFGDEVPDAPCHHHQAVDRLGDGLTVTAVATDGVVEAVEVTGHPFAVGVQWEAGYTPDDRLHRALAAAAAAAGTPGTGSSHHPPGRPTVMPPLPNQR